jgi:tetratricopeptide (TPR) repeat protein
MQAERELTTGLLSKDAGFRLVVSGPVGGKEIDQLIRKLELDKEIFVKQERGQKDEVGTRRRNILTSALAAGFALALSLAALAFWQLGIVVEQRGIAQQNEVQAKLEHDRARQSEAQARQEHDRAQQSEAQARQELDRATTTAQSLVFGIARVLRDIPGMSALSVRKILGNAKATFEQFTTSAPADLSLQHGHALMLMEFGETYHRVGDLNAARREYRDSLAIAERFAVADLIGSLAYDFVLAYDFAAALETADKAITLQPDLIFVYGNRAHALMFLDRVDEARTLYLRYRGKSVTDDQSWEISVLLDFAELREAGLSRPLMDEIESKYRTGG